MAKVIFTFTEKDSAACGDGGINTNIGFSVAIEDNGDEPGYVDIMARVLVGQSRAILSAVQDEVEKLLGERGVGAVFNDTHMEKYNEH